MPYKFTLRLAIGALLFLFQLLLVPAACHALAIDDAIDGKAIGTSLDVLMDEKRSMGIKEAERAETNGLFHKANQGAEPNFGYTDAAIWLHTTLNNHSGEPHWLLQLAFASLDEVELFVVDKQSGATVEHYLSGDTYPFSQRPIAHRHFIFPLTLAPDGNYDLYLRVRSEGTVTVPLFLWKASSFPHASRNSYMAIMLYFGILLALLISNLRLYMSLHDRIYLHYVGFTASIGLAMGAWTGLFFEYFWPDSPHWGNLAVLYGYNLAGLFGAIFSRSFLDSRLYSPRADRIMKLFAIAFTLTLLLIPFVHYHLIAMLTSAFGIVFSIMAVASGVHCLHRGQRSALYFLLGWSLLLAGTAVFGARNFGLLPTNLLTRYSMQIGSAIEVVLFSFALADRVTYLRREKELAEVEAMLAKKTMLETLERTEHELEARVKVRTEELIEINARLREQEERLTGLALYDPLTGLANRILLDEKLDEALANAKRYSEKVAVLLIDLDEFKPVNDLHGHDVGDALLRIIATRLKELVRRTDTVARFGGDEFVIIMPGLSDPEHALYIGESVVLEVSRSIEVDDLTLNIGASVGISVYPGDGHDAASLLRQADKAMYEAKRKGRNRLFLTTTLASA